MSHHAEHVDPNAWRGGGNKVGAVDAEVGSGYNMLHLFPDELRLVGAGSSKTANDNRIHADDRQLAAGHKSMVLCRDRWRHHREWRRRRDVKLCKADTLEELARRHGSPVYALRFRVICS